MSYRNEEEERETQDPPSQPEGGAPAILRNGRTGDCGNRCRTGMKKRKENPRPTLTPRGWGTRHSTEWENRGLWESMSYRNEEEERETQDPPSHPEGGAPAPPTAQVCSALQTWKSSMPCAFPRLREYFLSVALFQCSCTPRLRHRMPSRSGS